MTDMLFISLLAEMFCFFSQNRCLHHKRDRRKESKVMLKGNYVFLEKKFKLHICNSSNTDIYRKIRSPEHSLKLGKVAVCTTI